MADTPLVNTRATAKQAVPTANATDFLIRLRSVLMVVYLMPNHFC